jgi:hypothetical protein
MKRGAFKVRTRQAGTAAVEFSLVGIIFFAIVFGTLELARWEFLLNTLQEVTRRAAAAAANADFSDTALHKVQADAVFRDSLGPLAFGDPVTAENVTIDYLSVSTTNWDLKHVSARPACPARNQLNCMTDPHADNCIRFVRARVCKSMDDAGNCTPLSYAMVFPFLDLSGVKLPSSETIVPAGSLGSSGGSIGDATCS